MNSQLQVQERLGSRLSRHSSRSCAHPVLLPVIMSSRALQAVKNIWSIVKSMKSPTERQRDNRVYARRPVQYCPCHTHHKTDERACVRVRVGFQCPCSGKGWDSRCIPPVNNRLRGNFNWAKSDPQFQSPAGSSQHQRTLLVSSGFFSNLKQNNIL